MAFSGRKPLVVCNGQVYEADDEQDAKEKAQELALQAKTSAWILMPKWRQPGIANAPGLVDLAPVAAGAAAPAAAPAPAPPGR